MQGAEELRRSFQQTVKTKTKQKCFAVFWGIKFGNSTAGLKLHISIKKSYCVNLEENFNRKPIHQWLFARDLKSKHKMDAHEIFMYLHKIIIFLTYDIGFPFS